jgi:hypothetical protein
MNNHFIRLLSKCHARTDGRRAGGARKSIFNHEPTRTGRKIYHEAYLRYGTNEREYLDKHSYLFGYTLAKIGNRYLCVPLKGKVH